MFVFSRFTRYFLEVARLGSIRKASESLNVSASAIDRQILAAEEEIGLPLFERLPSGLRVTSAGELLLTAGRRWTKEFQTLQAQIVDLKGLRRGLVRIAIIDALAKGFLPPVLDELRRDYPGIVLDIMVVDNVQIQRLVEQGEVDFGLMLNPHSTKDTVVHSHRDVTLGFVTSPQHPLAQQTQARFNRCVELPIIAPGHPLALSEQVAALEAATGVALEPIVTCNSIQLIKSLVQQGSGVGILTSLDVLSEVEQGSIAFVPITDAVLRPVPLALCVGHASQLSRAARLALDRIEHALGNSDAARAPH